MEIYFLVLCCMLFATATSSNAINAAQEHEIDSAILEGQNGNCKCENGRCFTDKQGNMKCVCKPGFSQQEEFTCKPCDCGSLGKCLFILKLTDSKSSDKPEYQKKCVCDQGSAEKDGLCVNCFCGENSACNFDYGEKRCYCLDRYSEKDGVCTECDCGFYGKCEFERGNKKCECDDGYLEINGKCEECDCGDHGTCSFQSGQKTCRCQPGFKVNNGKCDACDCGSNSESCEFVNGVKRCNCKDRYADGDGTCEACYCGTSSTNCYFKNGQKTCSCLEDYVQKGETCEPACSTKNPCQNGGFCKEGFCFCQKGTRGEFCDVIDGCSDLCPNNRTDITCSYNVTHQGAYCRCLDNNLGYDHRLKQCRRTCERNDECVYGRCISALCYCFPAARGDRCEIIHYASGVIKCERQMYVFWWGGETSMFIFQGQNFLGFQRQDGSYEEITEDCDMDSKNDIQCGNDFRINWKGGDTLCVPWMQDLLMRFKRNVSESDFRIKCERQMHIIWWGGDTVFLFQGQNLLRFERQDGSSEEIIKDCGMDSKNDIRCGLNFRINWKGGDTLCIPMLQPLLLRFKRQESEVEPQMQE